MYVVQSSFTKRLRRHGIAFTKTVDCCTVRSSCMTERILNQSYLSGESAKSGVKRSLKVKRKLFGGLRTTSTFIIGSEDLEAAN